MKNKLQINKYESDFPLVVFWTLQLTVPQSEAKPTRVKFQRATTNKNNLKEIILKRLGRITWILRCVDYVDQLRGYWTKIPCFTFSSRNIL